MNPDNNKQHGVFSWNELVTTDVSAAKAFYAELLDWTLQDVQLGGMDYTLVKLAGQQGDRDVAGIMAMPDDAKGMPPAWFGYITVDDVDERAARVESLGGKVCLQPQDIPGLGRFAVITDPQGAMLSIITYFDKE